MAARPNLEWAPGLAFVAWMCRSGPISEETQPTSPEGTANLPPKQKAITETPLWPLHLRTTFLASYIQRVLDQNTVDHLLDILKEEVARRSRNHNHRCPRSALAK